MRFQADSPHLLSSWRFLTLRRDLLVGDVNARGGHRRLGLLRRFVVGVDMRLRSQSQERSQRIRAIIVALLCILLQHENVAVSNGYYFHLCELNFLRRLGGFFISARHLLELSTDLAQRLLDEPLLEIGFPCLAVVARTVLFADTCMQREVFDQFIDPQLFFCHPGLGLLLGVLEAIDVRAERILLISRSKLVVEKLQLVGNVQLVVSRPRVRVSLT